MDVDETVRALIDVDRVVHEPARLMIMAVLNGAREVDFLYLLNATGLTKGNLSSHLSRLEEAGYVMIEKGFVGKRPNTLVRLTRGGREALAEYRKQMRSILAEE